MNGYRFLIFLYAAHLFYSHNYCETKQFMHKYKYQHAGILQQ